MTAEVRLYTDGSCNPNPGPGGWGFILVYGSQEVERNGGELLTTNNRMEMMAVTQGLRALKRPCSVHVTTDSQYVLKGATEWHRGWVRRGWVTGEGEPVKNADLWVELLEEVARHTEVTWEWVRGHNGHHYNERVDALADQGRLQTIANRDGHSD